MSSRRRIMTLKYKGTGEAVRLARRILTTFMFRSRSTSIELQAFADAARSTQCDRDQRRLGISQNEHRRFHGTGSQSITVAISCCKPRYTNADERDPKTPQRASL